MRAMTEPMGGLVEYQDNFTRSLVPVQPGSADRGLLVAVDRSGDNGPVMSSLTQNMLLAAL
jgi:hypothetical protein